MVNKNLDNMSRRELMDLAEHQAILLYLSGETNKRLVSIIKTMESTINVLKEKK